MEHRILRRIAGTAALLVCATAASASAATVTLTGTVRDFLYGNTTPANLPPGFTGHPDFESVPIIAELGLVKTALGADGKPVYNGPAIGTATTHGPTAFNQWYNDTAGINQSTQYSITATDIGGGIFEYKNFNFFPIDGQLLGNQGAQDNYSFTFELHTQFTFAAGQTFSFVGDDDLWVFINKQLVIDLGGVHSQEGATVALNTLGLTAGNTYSLDLFFAERHTSASEFQIDTSIVLQNPPTQPTAAPEPSSILLWSLFGGIAAWRWRRRAALKLHS